MIISWGRKNTSPKIAKKPRSQLPCGTPPHLGQTTEQTPICAVIGRGHRRHVENEVQLATTAVAKIRGNATVSFGAASCRSNLEWYSTCPNFMSNEDPGKCWVMFWRLDSFLWKGVLCLEGSCHSTESQLGRPKLPNVCLSDFHLSALVRVFFRFLVLETHVSATCKTLLPIVAPMPPIKTSLSSWEFLRMTSDFDYTFIYSILDIITTSMPHWHPAISCDLGHHLHLPRCTHFQLLTHHPSYHQEFEIRVWHLRSTFDVRLLWPLQTNAIFQITTPISHRIVGVNNTSAVRTIWVTAYTTNFKTQATFGCEMTHLKPQLVWCSLKHDIHWTCCERQQKLKPNRRGFLNHWSSQPGKTQRHGLKKDGAIFRTWQCHRYRQF